MDALPELVGSVKVLEMPNAGKDELTEAWKGWIQQAVDALGGIPPGNAPGEKKWQQRRARAARPEVRLYDADCFSIAFYMYHFFFLRETFSFFLSKIPIYFFLFIHLQDPW